MKGTWLATRVKVLICLLNDENSILNSAAYKQLHHEIITRNFLEVFTPQSILKVINSTGLGGLNYAGIDTICQAIARSFPEDKPVNDTITTRRNILLP